MENYDQSVEFDKYCNKCEYEKLNQAADPCHECLSNPVNNFTNRPVNFKKRELVKKKSTKTINKNIKK